MGASFRGKTHKKSTIEKLRNISLNNWRNSEFRKKVTEGLLRKPNYPEKRLLKILDEKFDGWKYTGDFSYFIGGKNPDFVNENLRCTLDIFGEKWHSEMEKIERESIFRKDGWNPLILWAKELKKGIYYAEDQIIERITKHLNTIQTN